VFDISGRYQGAWLAFAGALLAAVLAILAVRKDAETDRLMVSVNQKWTHLML
jgi:hypothetical protein